MPEWLSTPALLWFILAVILIIAEILIMTFALFFFALGALGAACAAWLGLSLAWQITAFAVVTAFSLYGLRPSLHRRAARSGHRLRDDDLVGKTVRVLTPISAGLGGTVELSGVSWQAELETGSQPLAAGSQAVVTNFEGLILKVAARFPD